MLAVDDQFDFGGTPIAPEDAVVPKAQELIELLRADVLPFVRLLDVRKKADESELLHVEVQPEVPSRPVHDIRTTELIAIRFDPTDQHAPTVLAGRTNFPDVPHTLMAEPGTPKSLCLFDMDYQEQRLLWTAAAFLRQLQRWLSDTARGKLHEDDQPLEPFLVGSPNVAVLPSSVFRGESSDGPQRLSARLVPLENQGKYTLVATDGDGWDPLPSEPPVAAIVVDAEPQTQRGLRFQPRNLGELHTYMASLGVNLLRVIGDGVRTWIVAHGGDPHALLLLVVRIPLRRADDAPPENLEVWAFAIEGSLGVLGEALGVAATINGHVGALVGTASGCGDASNISIQMLDAVRALTRRRAVTLSGHEDVQADKILAIGAGALGSQTIGNLARGGFGRWTIVDRDVLLPHNLVRHALPGFYVGHGKAAALSHFTNHSFEGGAVAGCLAVDVLTDPLPPSLTSELETADVLVDFSASVPVARRLTLDIQGSARRLSVFLNPAGTDLVLLAEDERRRHRLDQLEMQYYRAVLTCHALADHLLVDGQRLRYGQTCRDTTSTIPQETLSMLSGVAAMALRDTINQPDARVTVWQTSRAHTISRLDVSPAALSEALDRSWRVVLDADILNHLHSLRDAALPNETGGILLGTRDMTRRILYVVDTIPSPPDSKQWPDAYIRGVEGLSDRIDDTFRRSAGNVSYLGEWHSHPTGTPCSPSADDRQFLAWLAQHMFADGFPGLMGIVCDGGEVGWHVASTSQRDG